MLALRKVEYMIANLLDTFDNARRRWIIVPQAWEFTAAIKYGSHALTNIVPQAILLRDDESLSREQGKWLDVVIAYPHIFEVHGQPQVDVVFLLISRRYDGTPSCESK
ncbi:hypothetical protein EV421DRAFT_1744047 [Armillaria borealis]|uniref:Uncharacterized protein n=1 Tax=Armillaria borealis TaxID=47425 RepID=A0AA39IU16_9AGAR|nr:hypothetical protein EV421DRAFT_1744047 [Armillaria borealis]